MTSPRPDSDTPTLRPWHDEAAAAPGPLRDDFVGARERLAHVAVDDSRVQGLRQAALLLADGSDWSRIGDQALIDELGNAVAQGRLGLGTASRPPLRRLVGATPAPPPPPPPAAAAAPAPRAAPAAPAPAPATTPFDVQAMIATLLQAAEDGVPFCEECLAAARAAEAAEDPAPAPAPSPLPPLEEQLLPALLGWVEVQLCDEAGDPVAGERWQILCADGELREGVTDAHGLLRLDGIAPGICRLSWPDRDTAAVLPA